MDKDSARVAATRKAFQEGNVDESKLAHLLPQAHKEEERDEGKYLKPVVFGGLDGISTIFAFLAGAVGANMGLVETIAIGCAQLFAGALGMGFGEYLSAKAEQDVASREQAREHWEVENNPEGEVAEMIQIYESKGLSRDDAYTVARTLSKYKDFWVEHMMLHEIGMFPPEEDSWQPVVQGIVMFFSFLILGGTPLIAYVVADSMSDSENVRAWAAGLASSCALLVLGMIKAYMADIALVKGGVSMMCQGLLCAAGAYVLGDSLPRYLKLE